MTDRVGRPQGGMKSEAGKAAYWRMQHESAIGALADLIAEHRELVERIEALADEQHERFKRYGTDCTCHLATKGLLANTDSAKAGT